MIIFAIIISTSGKSNTTTISLKQKYAHNSNQYMYSAAVVAETENPRPPLQSLGGTSQQTFANYFQAFFVINK